MDAKTVTFPSLPGATLLLGYPPFTLLISRDGKVLPIQGDNSRQPSISPSVSADGRVVASARRVQGDSFGGAAPLVVSTYDVIDGEWTDHGALEVVHGSVAISPDGSKVACVTRRRPGSPSRLHILDIHTEQVTVGPAMPRGDGGIGISWSPTTRHIAFDWDKTTALHLPRSASYVLDVETGSAAEIAGGRSPSWSPSGEWIAFFSDADNGKPKFRLRMMHADGSSARDLMTFRSWVVPNLRPVWSPDSRTLLVNVSRDPDLDTWDARLLDLPTLKVTKTFKSTPPVFGWVISAV